MSHTPLPISFPPFSLSALLSEQTRLCVSLPEPQELTPSKYTLDAPEFSSLLSGDAAEQASGRVPRCGGAQGDAPESLPGSGIAHVAQRSGPFPWDWGGGGERSEIPGSCYGPYAPDLATSYLSTCIIRFDTNTVEEQKWAQAISENSFVTFTDEKPSKFPKRYATESWFEVSSIPLDYAVLQLKGNEIPKSLFKQKQNTETPRDGTVFIIGHPEGWLKKIDICMMIPLAERENACQTVLQDRKKSECNPTNCPENKTNCVHMFSPKSFREHKVMDSEDSLTYHTSFFFGSSGSPVLDASGRLVALHAAGFSYTYHQQQQSIIEFGYSINSIHEDMVHNHGSWYNLLFPYQQDVEMESCDDAPQGFCLQGRRL
ncbi:serine protease FAM111A-like [Antechinus flavipes]|uniref:serine protease FAM111A-like n=1 Tax=Antechinus flavipes TaxID=38775 RepID=UPI0022369864|nr:serine protease FAM111A-like [Antechinus flavipes]